MNIVTHTSQVLEFRRWESPTSFITKPIQMTCATLLSLVILTLSLIPILKTKLEILECTRREPSQIECQFTTRRATGVTTKKIYNPERAEIVSEQILGRYGETTIYNLALIANGRETFIDKQETFILGLTTNRRAKQQSRVDRIDTFIDNSQQSIEIRSSDRLLGYIVSGLMILAGSALFCDTWFSKYASLITFNKDLAVVKIIARSSTGATKHLSWNLEQITGVSVTSFTNRYGTYYLLCLELNTRPSSINIYSNSSVTKVNTFATTISEFLDLPIS